jgi:hypothetical protein
MSNGTEEEAVSSNQHRSETGQFMSREEYNALSDCERRVLTERDRRYTEVAQEREKALQIKQTADEKALVLVAENQAYKDEKANNLREQIGGERGLYPTKEDLSSSTREIMAAVQPTIDWVTRQQGRTGTISLTSIVAGATIFGIVFGVVVGIIGLVLKVPA